MMIIISLIFSCLVLLVSFRGQCLCDGGHKRPDGPTEDWCEMKNYHWMFNVSTNPWLTRINQIEEVDLKSMTGQMILDYFTKSNSLGYKMRIAQIFSVKRKDHEQLFEQWTGKGETSMLLWHGTSMENLEGLLHNGFQLPVHTPLRFLRDSSFVITVAKVFGPGVFFADRSSKSAKYTERAGTGTLLLCEVALGQTYVLTLVFYPDY